MSLAAFFRRLGKARKHLPATAAALPIAAFATLVAAATEPMISWLVRELIDRTFQERAIPSWTIPTFVVGLFGIRGGGWLAAQRALCCATARDSATLRLSLFEATLQADGTSLSSRSAPELGNIIARDVQTGAALLTQSMLLVQCA